MFHNIARLIKKNSALFEALLIFIITIPSFFALFKAPYFSMHDNQHIARLYLLDQGIRQGHIYPRWVDMLGFGFGYPLFNFYPPFIYYIGVFFRLFGASYIWSIKLMIIVGFFLAAYGSYLFVKRLIGKTYGVLASVLYTYFFYHAVLTYVRGAFAEFFSMAIIPFLFIALWNGKKNPSLRSAIFIGLSFAILILTHPLIAFPTLFFVGFFIVFAIITNKQKLRQLITYACGMIIALGISAFFWLPSLFERKFTLVDAILTKELASYKIHYIFPQQFIYSPWGYGGSINGPYDGMTFQLGKIHLFLALLAIISSLIYWAKTRVFSHTLKQFFLITFLAVFSLFMTTYFSSFVWDNVTFLHYLQFPWRFLTFSGLFISAMGAYAIFFLTSLTKIRFARYVAVIFLIAIIIIRYSPYFKPQRFIYTQDSKLTSFEEIAWNISKSSFEFIPKGVVTKKTPLNTTTVDIEKNRLPSGPFEILDGKSDVQIEKNNFTDKRFTIYAQTPIVFQLNTYYFPGWYAYVDGNNISINDINKYKLITIMIPQGKHSAQFFFKDTFTRKIANYISWVFFISITLYIFLLYWRKNNNHKTLKK